MPSYGYRAVHVIVRTQGCLVEVQVRTYLQDMWAQIVERLADTFGRQIRYGEPPTDADAELGTGVTRQALVDALMAFSEDVDAVESMTIMLLELEADEAEQAVPARSAQLSEIRAKAAEVEREVRSSLERVHAMLHSAAEGSGGQT